MTDPTLTDPRPHPCTWSTEVLLQLRDVFRREHAHQGGRELVAYDPFAGLGLEDVANVMPDGWFAVGTELEPEWAQQSPGTLVADATQPPLGLGTVDVLVTSPCLTQNELVLTADLRWIPAGDVVVGDRLIAFDEHPPGLTLSGSAQRRRWRIATVTQAYGARKECVRVWLSNGESVTCTTDHPWLAQPFAYGGGPRWVAADQLRSMHDPHVYKQLEPWRTDTTRDGGWLAGMFDGEGSLSFGTHGSPKLMITQAAGPVTDNVERLLRERGYKVNVIPRRDTPEGRQQVHNVYVTGGFPGILQALGELRPMRLLDKLDGLDVASRALQPERVRVEHVEPIGLQDIAGIETSTGTYIGAGYLHHNTYGNRFADTYDGSNDRCTAAGCGKDGAPEGWRQVSDDDEIEDTDEVDDPDGGTVVVARCSTCDGSGRSPSKRYTYRIALGRMPSEGSTTTLKWRPGPSGAPYRQLHGRAWAAAWDLLKPGALVVVNVSNSIETVGSGANRREVEHHVSEWHLMAFLRLGALIREVIPVATRRMGNGANRGSRTENEWLLVLRKPKPIPRPPRTETPEPEENPHED